MEAVTIVAICCACIGCYLAGLRVGQAEARGEKAKLPIIKPVETVPKQEVQQETALSKSQLEIIMQNVDIYDGTEVGQVDVPVR